MSILEYNGSAVVAMVGKNCVGIASDTRFGAQQTTVSDNMKRIYKVNNRTLIGLSGLATDVMTVQQKLQEQVGIRFICRINDEILALICDRVDPLIGRRIQAIRLWKRLVLVFSCDACSLWVC